MIQIGVIGSVIDNKTPKKHIDLAKQLGKEIAKAKQLLYFGYEGDISSLSFVAAEEALKHGGHVTTFTWSGNPHVKEFSIPEVVTGFNRGGGREFVFIRSCQAVIAISGGSGTLMEIAMAYQAGIPIVVLENTGGWSAKLKNTFLDNRKRIKIISAKNPHDAVTKAVQKALLSKR